MLIQKGFHRFEKKSHSMNKLPKHAPVWNKSNAPKPKHFKGHNPGSTIPDRLKKVPEDLKLTDKCKLYIICKRTPNNEKTVQVHHGVKVGNINRVLSKRTDHNQLRAFITVRDKQAGTTRNFKIFS